jgi:adenosine deaminase
MLRERGTVLEVCPSSNLNTRVLDGLADVRRVVRALVEHEVRFTISTDGPEMLRTFIRDEILLLLRNEILTLDEALRAIEVGHEGSFLDRAPVIESSVTRRPFRRSREAPERAAIPVEARS